MSSATGVTPHPRHPHQGQSPFPRGEGVDGTADLPNGKVAGGAALSARRTRVYRGLLLAPLVGILVAWCARLPTDPDYWWHVRTGQLILQQGAVPRADVFSFTAAGAAWIDHEWLAEVVMGAVQQSAGYVGNVALFGAAMAAAAVALYRTCRLWGLGELPSIVLVLWAFAMSLPSAGVRPQTLTRLLLTLTALIATAYLRDTGGRRPGVDRVDGGKLLPAARGLLNDGLARLWERPGRRLWLLPPLFALWANLHAAFVAGLLLLGLAVVGQGFEWFRDRTRPAPWPLLAATVVSGAACLLTPNGLEGVLYPLSYARGNASFALIAEWQPPDLRQAGFLPFGASVLLAMAIGFGRRPLGLTHVLWGLAFGLLALQSIRQIALWATVATPLIGARLAAEAPALRRTMAAWRRPGRMTALWAGGLLAGIVLWVVGGSAQGTPFQAGREPLADGFPVGGAQYLAEHPAQGNVFNEYDWGGYLIYTLYPRQRVFVDGRSDLYGDAMVERYAGIIAGRPGWQQELERYGVTAALVRKGSGLAGQMARDPAWRQVYAGPVEAVFEKAESGS